MRRVQMFGINTEIPPTPVFLSVDGMWYVYGCTNITVHQLACVAALECEMIGNGRVTVPEETIGWDRVAAARRREEWAEIAFRSRATCLLSFNLFIGRKEE